MMQDMLAKIHHDGFEHGSKGSKGKKKADRKGRPSWKQSLQEAYAVAIKDRETKDTIIYTTVEEKEGFIASLSADGFATAYVGDIPAASKLKAEEAAAMAALEAEYPDVYERTKK